jgi:hypothetical protein
MIRRTVRSSASRWLAASLAGIACAPLGHLLAYRVRFGAEAGHEQSSGVHAYFPVLVATLTAGLGAALLASLLVVGAARLAAGRRRGERPGPRWPVTDLLAVLFTIQLGVFLALEVAEALAAGSPVPSAPELLLWGTLGQLPVALLAAVALSWLSPRLAVAVRRLRSGDGPFRPRPEPAVRWWASGLSRDPGLDGAGGACAKRGPPRFLDVSTF